MLLFFNLQMYLESSVPFLFAFLISLMCAYHLFLNWPPVDPMYSFVSIWLVIVALYITFPCKQSTSILCHFQKVFYVICQVMLFKLLLSKIECVLNVFNCFTFQSLVTSCVFYFLTLNVNFFLLLLKIMEISLSFESFCAVPLNMGNGLSSILNK